MSATARVTVLMEPAEKKALEARARHEKVSVGELMRRSVLVRQAAREGDDEQAFAEALAALGERAKAVIAKVDATHAVAMRERDAWTAREADIRTQAIADLTESDRVALARVFCSVEPRRRSDTEACR